MKKGKKKGSGVVLWSILTVLFTVLFAGACIGSNLAFASAQAVNIALKTPTHKTVGKDDSAVYYESDFSSVEELEAHIYNNFFRSTIFKVNNFISHWRNRSIMSNYNNSHFLTPASILK